MGLCYGGGTKKIIAYTIIILGPAGSGKSTFTKQVKMLHSCNNLELEEYRTVLQKNVISGLAELIKIAEINAYPINSTNLKYARRILDLEANFEYPENGMDKVVNDLWMDNAIQEAWKKANLEMSIQVTNLDFLVKKISDYNNVNYVLTKEDILCSRLRTTGYTTTEITTENNQIWKLIDVGGQKREREKWFSIVPKDTKAYIFFVALDEYNTFSIEDPNITKLQLAVNIFGETVNSAEFGSICPIVFFNKTDKFKEKISSEKGWVEFQKHFPDYKGDATVENAGNRISKEFVKKFDKGNLQVYFTCALDTEMMKTIFELVQKYLLIQSFEASGLF